MGAELLISTIGVEPLRCSRNSRRTKATYHFRKRCIQGWRAVTVSLVLMWWFPLYLAADTASSHTLLWRPQSPRARKCWIYSLKLEAEMGALSESKMPCRRFKLPLTFKRKRQDMAIQRYVETQRPYASYLPDTMDFVAKNNAFTKQQFRDVFLNSVLIVVAVEFFWALPIGLPIDPRKRMNCLKMNPSRVFTQKGRRHETDHA